MPRDRYLKIILTVIAIELGWLSVKDVAVPVSAQQTQQNQQQAGQLTPVVIRGIDLPCGGNTINCRETSLPVSVTRTTAPLRIAQLCGLESLASLSLVLHHICGLVAFVS